MGDIEIFKDLQRYIADINKPNEKGSIALHLFTN